MDSKTFLLYGANGYTARLIAREAASFGLTPILAGRSRGAIEAMASDLDLPFRCFALEDKAALESALREVKVVMHCAGPFIHTARPVVEACISTGTHYLDINGDITCFELVKKYGEAAAKAKQAEEAALAAAAGCAGDPRAWRRSIPSSPPVGVCRNLPPSV